MPRILVNYRRDDSAAYAGRLADRLREHFGRENVFVDIDTIRPGEDFVDRIDQSIAACDAMVAVIGKSWLDAVDSKGRRRLDREDDYVRMEIAKALERHIRVIPALVGDAALPEAAQLPQDLVALSRRQAIEISDSRFHHDVDVLVEALSGSPASSPQPAPTPQPVREAGGQVAGPALPRRWILGGALAIASIALVVWLSKDGAPSVGDTTAAGTAPTAPPTASVPAATSSSPAGGAPSTSAAGGSTASGAPGGAGRPAPEIAAAPAGKTGIQVVWRGESDVPCYLFDETGTKALSPEFIMHAWRCRRDMGLWDAAPGKYQIKFGEVADTMPPLPITVTRGQVLRVEPPVGQLRLHWNGSNKVNWYLLDPTGEKTLSPEFIFYAWECEAGKVCARDLGPGTYLVKVGAAGYQPVKVTIAPFRFTDVTIP
jgi:hypothetical protein